MTQNADKVIDHFELFRGPNTRRCSPTRSACLKILCPAEEFERVKEWTKSDDYREKNFARERSTSIPPRPASRWARSSPHLALKEHCPSFTVRRDVCVLSQPLFPALQGAYSSRMSSSMTEDAAVLGGLSNMIDGLANSYTLYKPKMIAVSTTCMAEVIGDDLNAFIKAQRKRDRFRWSSMFHLLILRPLSAAILPVTTMRSRELLSTSGMARPALCRSWNARPTAS
jgi:nitrogenase molybdenum-iron protein beta chain